MSPNRWSAQTLHRTGVILGALSLLAFTLLGAWFWQANDAQERADQTQITRLALVELSGKNLATQLDGQRAQFEACKDAKPGTVGCNVPVAPAAKDVAPAIATGPKGDQGYPGLQGPGPSTAQIAGAVTTYLAAHPAPAGKDGVTPDPDVITAQIRTAVAQYLSSNPPAAGKDGTDGKDGLDATDSQIAAAVADYCAARDGCRGPTGATGAPGAPAPTATTTPTPAPTPTATAP